MQEFYVRINSKISDQKPRLAIVDAYEAPTTLDLIKFWFALGTLDLSIFNHEVGGKIWCQYWDAWKVLAEHGWYHIGHKDQYLRWLKPDDEEADLLTCLLQIHDWTYQYADDHRSWRTGQDSWDRIIQVVNRMSKEQVHDIWIQYAPNQKEP